MNHIRVMKKIKIKNNNNSKPLPILVVKNMKDKL